MLTGLMVGIISSLVGNTLTDIWSGEPQPVLRGAGVFTIGKSTLDGPDTLG